MKLVKKFLTGLTLAATASLSVQACTDKLAVAASVSPVKNFFTSFIQSSLGLVEEN